MLPAALCECEALATRLRSRYTAKVNPHSNRIKMVAQSLSKRFVSIFSKPPDLDAEFAQKYFTLLVGQYKTMENAAPNPGARAEAESITAISVDKIEWEQIYRLELAILKLEPVETLRRKAWILREEYQEIATKDEKAQYEASNPPKADPATSSEPELRADLVRIQEELNWAYLVMWIYEEFRKKLTKGIVRTTLGAGLVFAFVLAYPSAFNGWLGFVPLFKVAFAGIVGGLVSTLRRIQTTKLDGNSDLSLIELEKGQGSIYISPFLGAIFSIVLYGLFASQLLKGILFPDVAVPLTAIESAKLWIWSFLAGFAEQFVPDRLNQLSQRGSAADKT